MLCIVCQNHVAGLPGQSDKYYRTICLKKTLYKNSVSNLHLNFFLRHFSLWKAVAKHQWRLFSMAQCALTAHADGFSIYAYDFFLCKLVNRFYTHRTKLFSNSSGFIIAKFFDICPMLPACYHCYNCHNYDFQHIVMNFSLLSIMFPKCFLLWYHIFRLFSCGSPKRHAMEINFSL